MGNPIDAPQTRVWLSLSALDDAMHFLRQQPLESLNQPVLDLLCCQLYIAAGLEAEAANLLYTESIDRHGDRIKAVITEVGS